MSGKLKIEYGPPSRLKPNPHNVNVVGPENEAKIDASIQRLGLFKPILCRELPSGQLEIVGGEHRWLSAQRLKLPEVPYLNLGRISDKEAVEIGLVDNGRYGADDSLRLATLLESIGADVPDLASFMPYSETDFNSIFTSTRVALDDLDLGDEPSAPIELPTERAVQTHQILRFKVPLDDAEKISARIKKVMKAQKFTDEDELTNAGNALVHILGKGD